MEERNFTFLSDAFTAIASSEGKDPILLSVEQYYTCARIRSLRHTNKRANSG